MTLAAHYLTVHDPTTRDLALRVADARAAYAEREHCEPNVVLLNPADYSPFICEIEVRLLSSVRRGTIWVGVEQ